MSSSKHARERVAIVCLGIAIALAAIAVFAAPARALSETGSLIITPSKVELMLDRGASGTFEVAVSNTTTVPMSVALKAWDFARDAGGNVHPVSAADAARFHGCSQWVQLPFSKSTVVEASSTANVEFTVTVPKNAVDGSRYCYLQFKSTPILPAKERSAEEYVITAPVVYSMNGLLLVQVGKPSGAEPAYKKGISLKTFSVRRINLKPQVKLDAAIYNNSTVHSNLAEGSGIQVWQGEKLKATIPFQEMTLLPENTIAVPATWRADAAVGLFKARFIGDVGMKQPLVAERTFWVVKPWFLAAVSLAAVVLVTLMVLFFRRFKIQLAPRSPEGGA